MGTNDPPRSPSSSSELCADPPSPPSPSRCSSTEPHDDVSPSPPGTPLVPIADGRPVTPQRDDDRNTTTVVDNSPIAYKKGGAMLNPELNLEGSRSVVGEDIGATVPEVSFSFLKDNVLPPLVAKIDIAKVTKKLEKAGVIDKKTGRWSAFPIDPSQEKPVKETDDEARKVLEDNVFGRLVDLVSAIISHSGTNSVPTLEYLSSPTKTPISVYDGKGGKPDGHLLFVKRDTPPLEKDSDRIYWRDICTPAEFKLCDNNDNIRDNNRKICWSMQQIMREDPRRRFIFAFTIQDTTMRIWFASRSEVLVSKPFNFIEDQSKFIHFILSQAFAEERRLGIDPTMKVVSMDTAGRLVYDITIRDSKTKKKHIYRTKELINDDGTSSLRGRGTRVWKVARVVGKTPSRKVDGVLKDYWIDEDREREGNILEELGQMYADHQDNDLFGISFLTTVAHGDVYIGKDCDNTRQLMTRGNAPPDSDKRENRFVLEPIDSRPMKSNRKIGATGSGATGEVRSIVSPTRRKDHDYWPKTHYRIIFQQVCKRPLSQETSLRNIFHHLASVVGAIQLLHKAKTPWVHRDISAGNILIDSEDHARLADLEYAKRLSDSSSHHVRTGTAQYMAVEVDQEHYKYTSRAVKAKSRVPPPQPEAQPLSLADMIRAELAGKKQAPPVSDKHSVITPPTFRYNTLHDMESVLWIAIDALFNRERMLASDPDSEAVALTEDERNVAAKLFYNAAERGEAMQAKVGIINNTIVNFPPRLKKIGAAILELKESLIERYTDVETDTETIGADACGELYDLFYRQFIAMRNMLDDTSDIIVEPIQVELEYELRKKPRFPQSSTKRSAPAGVMTRSKKKKPSAQIVA